MSKVSDAELEIMKIVWQHDGPISSVKILELLPSEIGWNKSTTLTLITRLADKGALKITHKIRKAHCYVANVSKEEFTREETRTFLDKLHGGKVKNLVASLFESNDLTKGEIEELRSLFERDGNK